MREGEYHRALSSNSRCYCRNSGRSSRRPLRRWQKAHKASLRPCISSRGGGGMAGGFHGGMGGFQWRRFSMRADPTAVASYGGYAMHLIPSPWLRLLLSSPIHTVGVWLRQLSLLHLSPDEHCYIDRSAAWCWFCQGSRQRRLDEQLRRYIRTQSDSGALSPTHARKF